MNHWPIVSNWLDKCSFAGSVSVECRQGACSPWRIPHAESKLYPFLTEGETPVAAACSGVRLTFRTDAGQVGLEIEQIAIESRLDVFVDGQFIQTVALAGSESQICLDLPGSGERLVEIWLDPRRRFWLRNILLPPGCQIRKAMDARRHWIHYGSSISHSMAAASPSQIWAGQVARRHDLHLTNLGFSGQCVLEPMIGRLIRDLPADLITLKLGINTHVGRLSARTFGPNAIGLIRLIREKHPEVPLVVISPIYSPPREESRATDLSMTLQEMRQNLADVVRIFQDYGDANIHYLDGLRLFGPNELTWLPDNLHPDAAGQAIMADHFSRELADILN